jgi:hypothetical protein
VARFPLALGHLPEGLNVITAVHSGDRDRLPCPFNALVQLV